MPTKKRKFKLGEIVFLRISNRSMIVDALRRNGRIMCVWLDGKERTHRAAFPAEALVKWEERYRPAGK